MVAQKLPHPTRVLANVRHGNTGRVLRLAGTGRHLPGQVLGLSLPPERPQRWYSISSAPGTEWIEVLYTRVEDGSLTPGLWQLEPGAEVWMQEPRGSFLDPDMGRSETGRPAEPGGKVWWICNGTGVSPFLAMLRDEERFPADLLSRRVLVYGCRTEQDAFGLEEIEAACQRRGLTCILCLSTGNPEHPSRDVPGASGLYRHSGRLTAWPGLAGIPADDRAMLCGASAMVAEVREGLQSRGMPLESIFAEIYF